ncbi:MAG: zinc-binding dehydrogenase [Tyzzerella sp.]|nr:zinc-binding dehydrogenase [Tyzzerella sp.]
MKTKAIVFTSPKVAEVLERDLKAVGANDVLVKLAVSSISTGTERANLVGEVNVSVNSNSTEARFPRTVGYSSAGVVEAVGENVTSVSVGDRVSLSWSKHSQYCIVPESNVHKILSDDISFEEAALWHISTFPMAAIRKCHLEIGESAVVMGMGILGIMAVKLLKLAGAAPIIAVDPVAEKRELALNIGADYVFDPFEENFAQKVKNVTDGGVNVAIEVTGNGGALNSVLDCMAKFGRVALLGCTRHSDFTIDYYKKVHGPGISLIGAHTGARPQMESAAGLWTTHDDVMAVQKLVHLKRFNLAELVEETYSPADAPEVFRRLAEEKTFPITQFDWRGL